MSHAYILFYYDPERVDPENVTIRDLGKFIVEDIVDAVTNMQLPKTQWSFKVRWVGYDETFNQWLDWNELRNVDALHRYLRRHNLAKFIPKSGQLLKINQSDD